MTRGALLTLVYVAALAARPGGQSTSFSPGADWPQWRGPERTGLSKESGLLRQWPASGPALLWSAANLGAGYGSLAVSGDRIFVQGTRTGRSVVVTLNRADGTEIWSKALGPAGDNDQGPGPRVGKLGGALSLSKGWRAEHRRDIVVASVLRGET